MHQKTLTLVASKRCNYSGMMLNNLSRVSLVTVTLVYAVTGAVRFHPEPNWFPYDRENGEDAVLECRIQPDTAEYAVYWDKDAQRLNNSDHYNIEERGQKLTIYLLKEADTGNYSCAVMDKRGDVLLASSAFIRVQSRTLITAPAITDMKYPVVFVKPGDDVNVSCTVNSGKDLFGLTVKWMRYGIYLRDKQGKYFNFDRQLQRNDAWDRHQYLTINNISAEDLGLYTCYAYNPFGRDNRTLELRWKQEKEEVSLFPWYGIVAASIGGVMFIAVIIIAIAKAVIRKRPLEPWLDVENYHGFDGEVIYDVFISYSKADLDWVKDELYSKLDANGYEVCVDFKDFLPGSSITTNIVECINKSRRTVVVMSNNFLKSGWGIFEMEQAHIKLITQRKDVLLIVKLDDCKIPSKLLGKTYLDWMDVNVKENFWKRLYSAIDKPDIPKLTEQNDNNHNDNCDKECCEENKVGSGNTDDLAAVQRTKRPCLPQFRRRSDHEQLLADCKY
ncbi:uncharacterized protein LOC141914825 [Tubulanus polymorphus]|uniref:uncharacterized protein LOC141914825 n=1 Tax=Tubulanus polymorphus TaxID=672921 RepID=UPI003DA5F595